MITPTEDSNVSKMQAPELMALPRAVMTLRLPWLSAYNLLLQGRLVGHQLPTGRWVVTRESVERYLEIHPHRQFADDLDA